MNEDGDVMEFENIGEVKGCERCWVECLEIIIFKKELASTWLDSTKGSKPN